MNNSVFLNCTCLTSVPDNLFINNSKITNFSDCFSNCTLLEPYPKYIRKQRKEKIEKLREKFGM